MDSRAVSRVDIGMISRALLECLYVVPMSSGLTRSKTVAAMGLPEVREYAVCVCVCLCI